MGIIENLSVAILSAGAGTRMKSQLPKVLHELAGIPMVHYVVREANKISNDVNIIVGHRADEVKKSIENKFENINFIQQDLENFAGTGGALRDLNPKNEWVLIINGDTPLVKHDELIKFINSRDENINIVLGVLSLENPKGYGRVVTSNDGKIIKIVEERDASEHEKNINLVNSGVYLIRADLLKKYVYLLNNENSQREFYLTDIVALAKNDGNETSIYKLSEQIFKGVNNRVELSDAEEIILDRIREKIMLNGTTIHLSKTVYIEESVEFIGENEIESGVSIYGNSKIINSVIKSGSVIESSYIEKSSIGVMAHIRPDSKIVDSKVGNFVEVKKSKLTGVKAGHLSYLGDSEIDEDTNIGAGVITANYDGKNKHKTKIGKNVFVGSDSQLIAPVEIPDNVMIGAGSTIPSRTEIESGSLVISRGNVRIIKNFFYKFFGTK